MDVRRRAGVPGLPDARAAAEALRGGGAGGADDARVRARRSRRTSLVSDILTPAPALAAELEGVPRGDARPPRPSRTSRRASRRSRSARGCRARGVGARAVAARPTALVAIGLEQGPPRVQRLPRAARARRRCRTVHTGLSRSLTMVGDAPAARVPARVAVVAARRRAAAVGAGRAARSRRRRAPARSCSSRPRRRRTRRTGSLRAALDGLARRAGARDRDLRPSRAIAAPANAVLVPWMSYAQTMPRCDLVVTHGGHGTLARALASGCPVRRLPGRRRHGRERRARGLGRRRRAARAALLHAVGRAAGGPAGAARRPRCARARRSSPRWASAHPGPATAAAQLERWAATVRASAARAPAESASGSVRAAWDDRGPGRVPVRPGVPPSRGRCRRRRTRRSGSPRRRGRRRANVVIEPVQPAVDDCGWPCVSWPRTKATVTFEQSTGVSSVTLTVVGDGVAELERRPRPSAS